LAIFLIFEVKKIRPENIAIKGQGIKIVFFRKNVPKPIQAGFIKKIFLLKAFQQSLNSGQKTADFRRY
jgi:hypothetical protein